MIQVLRIQDGLRAFQAHLAMAGDAPDDVPIYDRFALLSYRDVLPHDEHRFIDGPLILTDLAPLPGRALERLAAILKRLEETPLEVRVLNHPLTTPRRYELLRPFYEDGTNDHNVYRVIGAERPHAGRSSSATRSATGTRRCCTMQRSSPGSSKPWSVRASGVATSRSSSSTTPAGRTAPIVATAPSGSVRTSCPGA
jgi:hypothetical protein